MLRVGFSTTDSLLSRIIRWFTKSPVSHAYIVYRSREFGQEMVIEAANTGFRMIPYKYFCLGNQVVKEKKLRLSAQALKAAGDWLGEPYDYRSLVGNALVAAGKWFKRTWHHPFTNDKALVCSEAVVRMLQAVNYPGAGNLLPEETSPEDLMKFLEKK